MSGIGLSRKLTSLSPARVVRVEGDVTTSAVALVFMVAVTVMPWASSAWNLKNQPHCQDTQSYEILDRLALTWLSDIPVSGTSSTISS